MVACSLVDQPKVDLVEPVDGPTDCDFACTWLIYDPGCVAWCPSVADCSAVEPQQVERCTACNPLYVDTVECNLATWLNLETEPEECDADGNGWTSWNEGEELLLACLGYST